MAKVGQWRKYPPEFKQKALARMAAGENISALARELKLRRKFLYLWKAQAAGGGAGSGAPGLPGPVRQAPAGELTRLQKRIAELERLAGQQAAELDFFAAALRSIAESRPSNGRDSGSGSTPRSKG